MAEPSTNVEDLEDGEIESDGEDTTVVPNKEKDVETVPDVNHDHTENIEVEQNYYPRPGKKKKSKGQKKDKNKKNRKPHSPCEEDFAGSVEKAIRNAMNKNEENDMNFDDVGERRKNKKRKRYDGKEGSNKKRKKQEYVDEMDESEMMCVRGASPVQRQSPREDDYQEDDRDSYASDSSQDSRGHGHNNRPQRHNNRQPQRDRKNNKNERDRRRGAHPMQDPDGVCLYFMQGKCHKGDDCMYSHDAQPPRKMELCKFYLMDCCAKRDKCLYMHADFPCKYYHTGLPCIYKDECKFAHGPPLTESIKNILLKHIESAPKEILGDFPRLNREGALKMIQTTQAKLMHQFPDYSESHREKAIPSLFDLNIPKPQNAPDLSMSNQFGNDKQNKNTSKIRHSRWQNDNLGLNFNNTPTFNSNNTNVLNIKNLTGVLTPKQISDLTKMGIENLDQLGQLTVLQLNSIGISLKQITEIQLNTMNIQKLGLINANNEQIPQQHLIPSISKDLDLRVPPVVSVPNTSISSELPEKDVDMRFQPSVSLPKVEKSDQNKNMTQTNKDMIDIDQYTKDALKFVSKDKENIDISNDTFENEKCFDDSESKDVDHRVLPFSKDDLNYKNSVDLPSQKQSDTDIRFLQPEPIFKSPEKRSRRYTTDDDDENNLLIDEKWYSSDEEKSNNRKKSPAASPQLASPVRTPKVNDSEPSTSLSKILGNDLSKIDISEEVTKLLKSMKDNLQEPSNADTNQVKTESNEVVKSRDPRSRRSPDTKTESYKNSSRKVPKVSIYECIDGEPTDGRRRTDVDLRQPEFKTSNFGDTDLRQGTSGDIDLRLGLPFKPLPNYTPASEIDGSFNSHPPIVYKLLPIDIPRPDYTDIKNSTAKSQALLDPRLRKVFRLSLDDSNSDSEKPNASVKSNAPLVDPRRKPKENEVIIQEQKNTSLDLQVVIQNSDWYKDLSSTQKIFVNQQIATVSAMVKMFQQDKTPGKKMDVTSIQNNTALVSIFTNLGVTLGENGEFSYLPIPKDPVLKTPLRYNQSINPFGINNMQGSMENGNLNMMNMHNPPMGVSGVGPMNNMDWGREGMGFNSNFSDPRGTPAPGLLGIAPNIPHNFNNFSGPNNYGNMPFNGPGNDFGNMDGDQNYHRFSNRGRGRGNDRWNRGGGRGNRERKHFNDRGNWKNDRQ